MCDRKLTSEQRAKDIASRMTNEEKMAQLLSIAPPIPRLGIARYDWWSESLHGVMSTEDVVTMFPQIIGLGAGFNESMFLEMARIISTEARALANEGIQGLDYWAPNINIFRDPRWGRGQETPGEDPHLSSRYAINFAKGMQEGNDQFTKVVTTCKHFAAYSLEDWGGYQRYMFDAIVDSQDLEETYFPAFKACVVEGKVKSIMCSYNAINGVPACADPFLLQTKLRQEWNFNGYVVSDCDAIQNVYDSHHYRNTTYEACAVSLKAGTDLDCGTFYGALPKALELNRINQQDLNLAITRLFTQRIELGMFDRDSNPWESIKMDQINSPHSQSISLLAAQESIVLLKNDRQTLPIDASSLKSIAVIGPNADRKDVYWGNYQGKPPFVITALEGIRSDFQKVSHAKGCDVNSNDTTHFAEAIDLAKSSDVVVYVGGIDQQIESEGLDRKSISFPGVQSELISELTKNSKKPIIVVLVNGGPIDISELKSNDKIGAIVEAWYGGQSAGRAISDVIFGKYNPGGRLPVTFYPNKYIDLIPLTNMNMRPYPGRTYRYLQIEPVYKFGHGLSYTTFKVTSHQSIDDVVELYRPVTRWTWKLNVENVGDRDGDYVAMAFAKSESGNDDFKNEHGTLVAFKRVHVKSKKNMTVELELSNQSFERFRDGKLVVSAGDFKVTLTGTQPSNEVSARIKIL
ncbi:hypothetical protein AKO1_006463 [Acrasis kona]|uniref:Glycoside hydrolase family 3 protein n=1 Tax=Acrasis kona TaxID=1008807 RepID=A0AAW2ZND2_9EUKA